MRLCILMAALVAASIGRASAGAWTLDRGHVQLISGVTVSQATRSFDNSSRASQAVIFRKTFSQNVIEYGLLDSVTLFAAPEYVNAVTDNGGLGISRAHNFAVEGGARALLLSRIGMLSLQVAGKTAGAFDMSVSAGQASGSQVELRLLYGHGFKLFGRAGYVDFEVAERWIHRPRPNEMAVDASVGFDVRPSTQILLQTFNTISGGGPKAPYVFYRMRKFEVSVIQRITSRWSVQVGAITSVAGQNIVKEEGLVGAIWYRM